MVIHKQIKCTRGSSLIEISCTEAVGVGGNWGQLSLTELRSAESTRHWTAKILETVFRARLMVHLCEHKRSGYNTSTAAHLGMLANAKNYLR